MTAVMSINFIIVVDFMERSVRSGLYILHNLSSAVSREILKK